MTRKFLNKLVEASYIDESLDQQRVMAIAERVNRKELKAYIQAIKAREQSTTVIVDAPYELDKKQTDELLKFFPGKKLVSRKDNSLLLGLKITDNDTIYEMNLKDTLDNISDYLKETYD
jgi:F0F1-type ATP synthase delta subunit